MIVSCAPQAIRRTPARLIASSLESPDADSRLVNATVVIVERVDHAVPARHAAEVDVVGDRREVEEQHQPDHDHDELDRDVDDNDRERSAASAASDETPSTFVTAP